MRPSRTWWPRAAVALVALSAFLVVPLAAAGPAAAVGGLDPTFASRGTYTLLPPRVLAGDYGDPAGLVGVDLSVDGGTGDVWVASEGAYSSSEARLPRVDVLDLAGNPVTTRAYVRYRLSHRVTGLVADGGRAVLAAVVSRPPVDSGHVAFRQLDRQGGPVPAFGVDGLQQWAGPGATSDPSLVRCPQTVRLTDGSYRTAGMLSAQADGGGPVPFSLAGVTAVGRFDERLGSQGLHPAAGPAPEGPAACAALVATAGARTVVVTEEPVSGRRATVLRQYDVDGDLDTAFGDGGQVVLSWSARHLVPVARGVARGPDGSLYVGLAVKGADQGGRWRAGLARVTAEGTWDRSFGYSGLYRYASVLGGSTALTSVTHTGRRVLLGMRDAGPDQRSTYLLGVSPSTARTQPTYGKEARVMTPGPVARAVAQVPGRVLVLVSSVGHSAPEAGATVVLQRRSD